MAPPDSTSSHHCCSDRAHAAKAGGSPSLPPPATTNVATSAASTQHVLACHYFQYINRCIAMSQKPVKFTIVLLWYLKLKLKPRFFSECVRLRNLCVYTVIEGVFYLSVHYIYSRHVINCVNVLSKMAHNYEYEYTATTVNYESYVKRRVLKTHIKRLV